MELMPVYGVFFQKKEFFPMKKKSRSQGKNRKIFLVVTKKKIFFQ